MPKLIVLVGIPGCGKSTWAKSLLDLHYFIHSSDAIREEFGDVNDQTRNAEVFDAFHERIARDLAWGYDVVADSTALDARARKRLRQIALDTGAEIHLVYFSNYREAVRRNTHRERRVPDDVMIRMLDKYEIFKTVLVQEIPLYKSVTEIRSFL